ncbi:uncharacterized protein LOC111479928 isoform X1 [Cucurbita maxima]|uniref:Uncharacterized protein LOC111479928 isoform X1 n=1 Tax=Cucurbita maxima TaxID=3661 RepID=A0A6J1IRS7_CUCMA|nr:uncharacterized protein LOC111479928 isoform X1 [Cucurbita maxima]XP_022980620.1 uncharacterized protein LOC111479928 isoform X1 [Cucurbita maxima]
MKNSFTFVIFILVLLVFPLQIQVHATPAGPLIKHLSSIVKWTRSSYKAPPSGDGNVLQFENGYLVETVVEANEIGVLPHKIHVSKEGELFVVDSVNSNIVKITPPLSKYTRARLVAGSFQSHTGHVDGKPNDARFNHPKGVTVDDKGNVYVADTLNLAIRKIGDAGVTTIAGGKSNVAGYRDGPGEDAKFSNDFDVMYIRSTCSLLVIDRGNAAIRQIFLNPEDCEYQDSSISNSDVLMIIGAVLAGYATYMLQQGFGASSMSQTYSPLETEYREKPNKEESTLTVDSVRETPGWPSFGRLIIDLSKLALEAVASIFLSFVPARFRARNIPKGLTPLKDSLWMPEDEPDRPPAQMQRAPVPLTETRQAHIGNANDQVPEVMMKPPKLKSSSFKDPSLQSKHRSKRHDRADFYESGEIPPPYSRSKSQKERPRHRQREKSAEIHHGAAGPEPKPMEMKPVNYDNSNLEHYNIRNKYEPNTSYGF